MKQVQALQQQLDSIAKAHGPAFYKKQVPAFIYENLRHPYGRRPYQQEAFGRFVFYWSRHRSQTHGNPVQLLFHMATGSGKTVIMAGLLLYLYEQGYRNFLFFVNSTNIIEKTKDNFLNPASSKYLFGDKLSLGGKQVEIKEVENFQTAHPANINLVFSTVQGLHARLNAPTEASLTYEDFAEQKLVLLSDEAHHLNADTKMGKESAEEKEAMVSWEGTVNKILGANSGNVLLEFTATTDFSHRDIAKKYSDKLLYDYPLKQFRKEGYSKEVKVLQAGLPPFERALQAVLLSQYRQKLFESHGIPVKPVILFKSKTIKESQAFYAAFVTGMKNLQPAAIEKIARVSTDKALLNLFAYMHANGLAWENLVTEIQEDFSPAKLLSVNSKEESEQKQLAVNALEDEGNPYRAVFAVDKLNEGWDVLNLFDIVRLYDTRDTRGGRPGKTTLSEAQLIGRGARYCPFQLTATQARFVRKYDDETDHPMRLCEELYYHSAYNPKYIQELHAALEEIGMKEKADQECTIRLKPAFKQTAFYNEGVIFLNEREGSSSDGFSAVLTGQPFKVVLPTGFTHSSAVFAQQHTAVADREERALHLLQLGAPVIRKAINKLPFYRFASLKQLLPGLPSISTFIHSPLYLGNIQILVSGLPGQIEKLSAGEKLAACLQVLEKIARALAAGYPVYKGSKTFHPFLLKDTLKDKTIRIATGKSKEEANGWVETIAGEATHFFEPGKKEWYVFENFFGTLEESAFLQQFDKGYAKLAEQYEQVFLVQNYRQFAIFNFADGKAVAPDFVLFLVDQRSAEPVMHQVFLVIDRKPLPEKEQGEKGLLHRFKDEHKMEPLHRAQKIRVWGLLVSGEQLAKADLAAIVAEMILPKTNAAPVPPSLPVQACGSNC